MKPEPVPAIEVVGKPKRAASLPEGSKMGYMPGADVMTIPDAKGAKGESSRPMRINFCVRRVTSNFP